MDEIEATKHMRAACHELGLQEDIEIYKVQGIRWFMRYEQQVGKPIFQVAALRVEGYLQALLKQPVDLRFEPRADKMNRMKRNVLSKKE